jgi:hypothetical protein
MFADAVKATVVKGDSPNFDMPQDDNLDSSDIAFDTLKPAVPRKVAAGRQRIGRHLKPRSVCRSIAFDWCCGCVSNSAQSTGRQSICAEIV